MAVLLGAVTAAVVWMFFDGTAVTANRVVTVVCALWLYWAPAVIMLRALVVIPVGSGWFPGGMVRRLIRVAVLARIAQLNFPTLPPTPDPRPVVQPTGARLLLRPWSWHAAFDGGYRQAIGADQDLAEGTEAAGSPLSR